MNADDLDHEITAALRGTTASDPTLRWLVSELRSDPPMRLRRRLAIRVLVRRWSVAQYLSAALGGLLLWHGLSSIVLGEWIARNLGEPFAPHATLEGGLAIAVVGWVAIACAARRSWLPISLSTCAPLGVCFALHGLGEVSVFAWGAVLHLAEGFAAVAMVAAWALAWRRSRYSSRPPRKEGA